MADRKKTKRKTKESDVKPDEDKPSKVEYEVAKYLRSKLPAKKTTLLSHKVDYFIASKAIDLLLDSKWAQSKKTEPLFTNRPSVVDFMNQMLRHKFFHRAKTVVVKKEDKKKKKDEESGDDDGKEKKQKRSKESVEKEKSGGEKSEAEGEGGKKKKEKKKVKLDMHFEQIFVDGNEPFVWIYDPIPLKTWIIGALLVFGAIAVCLFPLWPRIVRNYVYYLSVAAAAFLFFIIGLAVLRLIIFTLVWLFTFGKHHFWLLPNLTEDVGFLDSFWPLYKYEFKGQTNEKEKEKEKKKKKTHNKGPENDSVEEGSDKEPKSDIQKDDENGFEILENDDFDDSQAGKAKTE